MPINLNGQMFTDEQLQVLVDSGLLTAGKKNDLNNTDYFAQASHGYWSDATTAGLFTRPGVEPDMLSAIRYPEARLIARLWRGVTDVKDTEYEIITGVDGAQGSNASDWCDEAPRAGFARLCTQRSQFGKFRMATDSVKLAEIGGRINRADVDRQVVNLPEAFPLVPDNLAGLMNAGGPLNTALGLEVFRLGIHTNRVASRVLVHGALTNTGAFAETGFMQEFDGFDAKIKTGHVDLESGLFCPAADSIVEDFNNGSLVTNAADAVELISNIYYRLEQRQDANALGMDWQGFLLMDPDMFFSLTAVWPCSYLTDGCGMSGSNQQVVVTGNEQVAMRDQMRQGRFLWILGKRIAVETSRAIKREAQGAGFKSPIYFVNTGVPGMAQTTYIEAFDMGRADVQAFLSLLPSGEVRVTNGGLYLSTFNREGTCMEYEFNAQMRLVVRAPWLCARLENVVYAMPGYSDDVNAGDVYYRAGGRYYSNAPSIYVAEE